VIVLCALTDTAPVALTVAFEPMSAQTYGSTLMKKKLAVKAPMPPAIAVVEACGVTVEFAETPSEATVSKLAPSSTAA
jgi:hypothetical protein